MRCLNKVSRLRLPRWNRLASRQCLVANMVIFLVLVLRRWLALVGRCRLLVLWTMFIPSLWSPSIGSSVVSRVAPLSFVELSIVSIVGRPKSSLVVSVRPRLSHKSTISCPTLLVKIVGLSSNVYKVWSYPVALSYGSVLYGGRMYLKFVPFA